MPSAVAAQQNPSPPSRWRYWWLAGLAGVYSGLVYANALANPYAYDDMRTVQNNPSIESIYAVKRIILRESMRPLVNMTYALDRAIWPWELIGHHLTSILLHVVNVLLLFQLAWLATEDMRRRGASGPSERVSPVIVAFVSAALFGLHPMMTEAVGYISGRSESYGTFFLLALCRAALDDGRRDPLGRHRGRAVGRGVVLERGRRSSGRSSRPLRPLRARESGGSLAKRFRAVSPAAAPDGDRRRVHRHSRFIENPAKPRHVARPGRDHRRVPHCC